MSFERRLVHRLALVEPNPDGDPTDSDNLDEYGQAVAGEPTVTLLWGLVQPRTSKEQAAASQGGAEYSDHTIYLMPRSLVAAGYLADADADGPLATGRRFDIVGVRSFEFGGSPHLEVDCKLVGSTEGPAVGS